MLPNDPFATHRQPFRISDTPVMFDCDAKSESTVLCQHGKEDTAASVGSPSTSPYSFLTRTHWQLGQSSSYSFAARGTHLVVFR